jgi:hypothetical protein
VLRPKIFKAAKKKNKMFLYRQKRSIKLIKTKKANLSALFQIQSFFSLAEHLTAKERNFYFFQKNNNLAEH